MYIAGDYSITPIIGKATTLNINKKWVSNLLLLGMDENCESLLKSMSYVKKTGNVQNFAENVRFMLVL